MTWTPSAPSHQLEPFDEVRRIATEALRDAAADAPATDVPYADYIEAIMQAVSAYGEQIAANATPEPEPEPIGTELATAALLIAATVVGDKAGPTPVTDWAEQHALPWLLATAQQPRP